MIDLYKKAWEMKVPRDEMEETQTPGEVLLDLLTVMGEWLSCRPVAEMPEEGREVYLFFRDAAFVTGELACEFAASLAIVDRYWPLVLYAAAQNGETVSMRATTREQDVLFVQETISGKPAEVLEGICIRLQCPEREMAQSLAALFEHMDWESGTFVVEWSEAPFLREQGLLLEKTEGAYYCYGGLEEERYENSFLQALDFRQKIRLWNRFLQYGEHPMEFAWLFTVMNEEELPGRAEWELALWKAMEEQGYQAVYREKNFEIYDGNGQRRYFSGDGKREAEVVLMKLLFPL